MTDPNELGATEAPEPRRPSPAATAASRARRIGGRGVAATHDPAPDRPAETSTAKAPDRPASAVVLDKAPRPGQSRVVVAVPPWLRWLPAGLLGAGALAMAALLVVFSHGVWWATPSSASTRDRVLASAKSCMVAINTYSYTDLAAYETKALACTTGTLTSDLRQAITTIVKVRAPQLKASQTIQINNAGIESAGGGHWSVLIFAQVNLKSTTYPKGSQTPYAAEVQMTKVGGKWLLSRETTLGNNASSPGGGSATPAPSGSASPTPSGSPTPSTSGSTSGRP